MHIDRIKESKDVFGNGFHFNYDRFTFYKGTDFRIDASICASMKI